MSEREPSYAIEGEDRRLLVFQVLLALLSVAITVAFGVLATTAYTPFEATLREAGFTLQHFRPIHESFAFAWIFLGGVAVVYYYLLSEHGPFGAAERLRFRVQMVLWSLAGAGILVSNLAGRFTGREYGAHEWPYALLIIAGWVLFGWNLYGRVGIDPRKRPVFVIMWMVSIPLFLLAYGESFLWMLDAVGMRPIKDLQVQWRSNGVLVGAFNQLAYGCLMYIGCRIRRDFGYAFCRLAFSLFAVGMLNTLTNYGHHTYHLPQSSWINWISFIVSMLEIAILAKVSMDVAGLTRAKPLEEKDLRMADGFARSTTLWIFLMLFLAMVIAIPPLNALVHGTHVIVAHSMGSMLGIDTMILLACLAYVLRAVAGREHPVVRGQGVAWTVPTLNWSIGIFWVTWITHGATRGLIRYRAANPDKFAFVGDVFPWLMVLSGLAMAGALTWLIGVWALTFWQSSAPLSRPLESPGGAD